MTLRMRSRPKKQLGTYLIAGEQKFYATCPDKGGIYRVPLLKRRVALGAAGLRR